MKIAILALSLLVGSVAQADGFECETESGLNVKIYNHTSPEVGTRVPAVMIISDSKIQHGRKTVATFTDAKGVLENQGQHSYVADVDLRLSESNRKGELLAGTKLGNVDQIRLDVDFSYSAPVMETTMLPARLLIAKRDGSAVAEYAICHRYLKQD